MLEGAGEVPALSFQKVAFELYSEGKEVGRKNMAGICYPGVGDSIFSQERSVESFTEDLVKIIPGFFLTIYIIFL